MLLEIVMKYTELMEISAKVGCKFRPKRLILGVFLNTAHSTLADISINSLYFYFIRFTFEIYCSFDIGWKSSKIIVEL